MIHALGDTTLEKSTGCARVVAVISKGIDNRFGNNRARREVDHGLHPVAPQNATHQVGVGHVAHHQRPVQHGLPETGIERIQHNHAAAPFAQLPDYVAADVAGASCNQDGAGRHRSRCPTIWGRLTICLPRREAGIVAKGSNFSKIGRASPGGASTPFPRQQYRWALLSGEENIHTGASAAVIRILRHSNEFLLTSASPGGTILQRFVRSGSASNRTAPGRTRGGFPPGEHVGLPFGNPVQPAGTVTRIALSVLSVIGKTEHATIGD